LIALNPDLVAGSVSGMEVPLATLIVAGVVAATVQKKTAWLAILGAAAVAARPETALFAVAVPILYWARETAVAGRLASAAAGGTMSAALLLGARNYTVAGTFLPATFHAKVDVGSGVDLAAQMDGFRGVLGQLSVLGMGVGAFSAVGVMALVFLGRRATSPEGRAGSAMFVAGLAYCAVSFALVRPLDPMAFYHQRYVLPAVVLLVAALPLLAREGLRPLGRRPFFMASAAVLALLFTTALVAAPSRYRRLSNDARNIDDVQVAMGRALAAAAPSDIAWVVDAGASRFFGRAFVIDLVGLNTPEMLGPGAQTFLDRHPPRYLDVFPGWSEIDVADDEAASLPSRAFTVSTPYTVTSYPAMGQHVLVSCEPPGTIGHVKIRGRAFSFHCHP
jgi:hypothetical protein